MKRASGTASATASEVLRAAVREFCDGGGTLFYLARAAGMSRPSIIHFLSGKQSLRLDLADRLISYFGLALTRTGPLPVQPITPLSRAAALKRARSKKSRAAGKSATSTGRTSPRSKRPALNREGL